MRKLLFLVIFFVVAGISLADNPFITHLFTADPSAHVFNGVLYVYPSHDVDEAAGVNGFSMRDYHVFSTTDLMNYTDHGVALDQDDVPWGTPNHTMWAPDCNQRGTNYYFYFPMNFKVGVAISDSPAGPFVAEPTSIPNANAIDPCLFIDDDVNQTPYLYFGGGTGDSLRYMRMQTDMVTPDSGVVYITGLSSTYKEGAFVFKRNGIYYLTYPDSISGSEEIRYATSSSPTGPFTVRGTILDRWTDGCWTSHHSLVEYNGQWYLFYHHKDISGDQTLRSICVDKVNFNGDGTIQKVTPTRRGVGIRKAEEPIQIDRYLTGSGGLSTPVFSSSVPSGFYLSGIDNNNWVNYPDVDFGTNGYVSVTASIASTKTGSIEVRVGGTSGTLLGTIPVTSTGSTSSWDIRTATLEVAGTGVTGVQDLYLVFKGSGSDLFNVDWVRFNWADTAHLMFAGNGVGDVVIDRTDTIEIFHPGSVLNAPSPLHLRATAQAGSYFAGWELNGVSVPGITTVYPADDVTAIFSKGTDPGGSQVQLEAENYSTQSGIQTEACDEGGQNIGYIENGDYVRFNSVNLVDAIDLFSARVASDTSGGTISVCLDDINATPVCTLAVPGTTGWQTWQTESTSVSIPAGTYDVFFKFSGGGGFLFNVNWFSFITSSEGGYQAWVTAQSASPSGYLDDPDSDNMSNLVEYGIDQPPMQPGSVANMMIQGTNGLYMSHTDKTDVDVKLFYKANMNSSWVLRTPSLTPTNMPANTVYYEFDDTIGFMKWQVEAP